MDTIQLKHYIQEYVRATVEGRTFSAEVCIRAIDKLVLMKSLTSGCNYPL